MNTDVPGDYTLTYQADFRGRSYTAKRLVHVEDREAPELTLTGQAEVTVSRYDLFQDPGAAARRLPGMRKPLPTLPSTREE